MSSSDLKRNATILFHLPRWIVNYGLFTCISHFKSNPPLGRRNQDHLSAMISITRGYVTETIAFTSTNASIVTRITLLQNVLLIKIV